MNMRLQKYKKNRLKGMNQYNAARAAGYSETMARSACRIEKSAKISMADAFEQAGVTDQFLIAHALEGLQAVKANGMSLTMPLTGDLPKEITDIIKESKAPDWTARHKYFETILKLTEKLKDKLELSGQVKVVKMNDITVDGKPLRYRIGQYADQSPGVVALPSEASANN